MSFVNVLILQAAVLAVILESDLGRRRIGALRIWRPVVTLIIIIPFFLTSLPTTGNDPAFEILAALVGIALGLASVSPGLVTVEFDSQPRSRWQPFRLPRREPEPAAVSHAGVGYAAIWIGVAAARLAFAYAAVHVFPDELGRFLITHQLSPAGLTDALIFLSLGMDLARSAGLIIRRRLVMRNVMTRLPLASQLGDC